MSRSSWEFLYAHNFEWSSSPYAPFYTELTNALFKTRLELESQLQDVPSGSPGGLKYSHNTFLAIRNSWRGAVIKLKKFFTFIFPQACLQRCKGWKSVCMYLTWMWVIETRDAFLVIQFFYGHTYGTVESHQQIYFKKIGFFYFEFFSNFKSPEYLY